MWYRRFKHSVYQSTLRFRYSCAGLNQSESKCCDHFSGYAPRGSPVVNWFPLYPERVPLLGNLTIHPETIAREVAVANANIVRGAAGLPQRSPLTRPPGFFLDAVL